MVSGYLGQTNSLTELQGLLESRQIAETNNAITMFEQEVSASVSNIGEINQVANARILSDSQVASAKMMTDAEVTATMLMAKASVAKLEIQKQSTELARSEEIAHSMIIEIGRNTADAISCSARDTVKTIKNDAEEAIRQLKKNAANAIEEIRALAEEVGAKVEETAEIAIQKLSKKTDGHPHTQNATRQSEEAAKIIINDLSISRGVVQDTAEKAIAELNAVTHEATEAISAAVRASENRVVAARDRALSVMQDIVSNL